MTSRPEFHLAAMLDAGSLVKWNPGARKPEKSRSAQLHGTTVLSEATVQQKLAK
jgi:hypothetical protein